MLNYNITYIDIETIICDFLIETEEQYNIFKKKLIEIETLCILHQYNLQG